MSTRSVIARKNGTSGFIGVYHHWDGYPSGLGATLHELRNGHFQGSTEHMLRFLIDEHPAGWSTINGADFSQPPGARPDMHKQLCRDCYRPIWTHYKQYYNESCPLWVEAGKPPLPGKVPMDTYKLFPCSALPVEVKCGPVCFVDKSVKEPSLTEQNSSECGCEYAYVFDDQDTMLIMVSYCGNGDKMIGMFGCGDPEAKWRTIAEVNLNAEAPDWKEINELAVI